MVCEQLKAKVEDWISGDVDEDSIKILKDLLAKAEAGDEKAEAELKTRFSGPLEFGTAGLRGEMGPGESFMNRSIVIKAAAGLAAFAKKKVDKPTVVIGYDARYNSKQFAIDSAGVFVSAGLDVVMIPQAWPTPLLAFTLRHLNKDVGVMVTASHNPGKDNGYKVYLGGRIVTDTGQGSQIVPPYDGEIFEEIKKIDKANEVERATSGWGLVPETILDDYLSAVSTPAKSFEPLDAHITVVTTAMHGVGGFPQEEALRRLGFDDVHHVPEQQEPDPAFPTVSFPNPEEKGALDLALALGEKMKADLIIANDPDADRCAMGAYDPHVGKYRQFGGDETGALFGQYFAKEVVKQGGKYGDNEHPVLVNSIVSSRLLEKIATSNGLGHKYTLTGFKWVSRVENEIYGYEEAIGYDVIPNFIHDKDGIGAGTLITKIVQRQKQAGKSLVDMLDDMAREYGLYSQRQVAIRLDSKAKIEAVVEKLRNNPPSEVDGAKVVETHDLANGYLYLPPTNGIMLLFDDDTRIICRPSGTEPKVKFYVEIISDVPKDASFDQLTEIRAAAQDKLGRIEQFILDYAK